MSENEFGYGGDPLGGCPPYFCPCRNCRYRYTRDYSGGNGGSGGNYRLFSVEGLENINRTLSALGALIENICVSLGVEVKGSESPSKDGGFNVAVESPVEGMKQESAVGGGPSGIGSEKKQDGG
jgi:hypothetical protein